MTWTKTPDDYPDRLLELSDAAYRLHHAATVYCNRVGLDGRLTKARVSLVPVPPKARRPSVVRELEAFGLWARDGDEWELVDFFDAQLSAEEVAATRRYDAIRQRIRFAKDADSKRELKLEEDAVKRALYEARERRRARTSHRESQGESQRPAPIRTPTRPVPHENEGEGGVAPASSVAPTAGPPDACQRCHRPLDGEIPTYVPGRGYVHGRCPELSRSAVA